MTLKDLTVPLSSASIDTLKTIVCEVLALMRFVALLLAHFTLVEVFEKVDKDHEVEFEPETKVTFPGNVTLTCVILSTVSVLLIVKFILALALAVCICAGEGSLIDEVKLPAKASPIINNDNKIGRASIMPCFNKLKERTCK